MSLVARVTALAQTIAADIKSLTSGKVDKVGGKGLSTEDYSTSEKNKLSGIASGAQANPPIQTSQLDRTIGVLMPVGAFGLGKLLDLRSSTFSGNTPPSFFFGTGTTMGFIAGGPGPNANQLGLEIPQLIGARNYGILTTHGHWTDATGGGGVQQIFTTGDRTFTRLPTSADAWANWREQAYMEAVDAKANTAVLISAGFLVQSLSQPSGSDFNNAGSIQFELKTGISSTLNKPAGAGNGWVNVLGMPRDASNGSQLATGVTAEGVWYRRKENAVYKDWRQLSFTDNPTFLGDAVFQRNGQATPLLFSLMGDAGQAKTFRFGVGTQGRWDLICNEAAESGSNTGSNFVIASRSDTGAYVRIPLSIDRASGVTTLSGLVMNGPSRVAQYTLTTLPSASAYNGHEIDVTNATVSPAGPKRCRSNGTNWLILNTNTPVS
ncbi:hypothetical protein [Pseudomonas sp. PS01301]|uniref:hypothetical protein n=1 Tax=Pseudomonas sp. PS01301 TaxID=2991437 RepID=UPI00249B501D|nr:hypothetical protein [Pseudomonas sp. PS01301]